MVKYDHDIRSLAPLAIGLLNRPNGPQIITRPSSKPFIKGPAFETVTVAGTWRNDYGSVMTLETSGQQLSGSYQSSTGSTGEYSITGCLSGAGATRVKNQPVALAIEWHDLDNGNRDPSWNWASGLSGQLSVTDQGDVLTLNHVLVATSDFPELARQGRYIDKLVYRRLEQQAPFRLISHIETLPIGNSLAGRWVTTDGIFLVLSVHSDSKQRLGFVRGSFTCVDACNEVTGFTDINAQACKLSLQSVSLTAANIRDATVSTLCGTLDLVADTLNLLVLNSSAVAPAHAYLATQISSMYFKRAT